MVDRRTFFGAILGLLPLAWLPKPQDKLLSVKERFSGKTSGAAMTLADLARLDSSGFSVWVHPGAPHRLAHPLFMADGSAAGSSWVAFAREGWEQVEDHRKVWTINLEVKGTPDQVYEVLLRHHSVVGGARYGRYETSLPC